jgi:hypothetical protein
MLTLRAGCPMSECEMANIVDTIIERAFGAQRHSIRHARICMAIADWSHANATKESRYL